MTRDEHLAWCKARALEYLDAGDLVNAVASMASDLTKHPETGRGHDTLMMLAMMYVTQPTRQGCGAGSRGSGEGGDHPTPSQLGMIPRCQHDMVRILLGEITTRSWPPLKWLRKAQA